MYVCLPLLHPLGALEAVLSECPHLADKDTELLVQCHWAVSDRPALAGPSPRTSLLALPLSPGSYPTAPLEQASGTTDWAVTVYVPTPHPPPALPVTCDLVDLFLLLAIT